MVLDRYRLRLDIQSTAIFEVKPENYVKVSAALLKLAPADTHPSQTSICAYFPPGISSTWGEYFWSTASIRTPLVNGCDDALLPGMRDVDRDGMVSSAYRI